ncbi:uncharacterized protein LOC109398599 [Aedes albopictus]|uniref:Tox-SGS domain-containing protein n=1 Tax=Aedes albopictus TaxID=7160 RepID=A0ABM1ZRV1_AEDAL
MQTTTEIVADAEQQPKVLEKAVLEFRNSSTLVEELQGPIEAVLVPNGSTSGQSMVGVKYKRHLLVYRFDDDRNRLTLLDGKYDVFDTETERRLWWLTEKRFIGVQNGTWVDVYRVNERIDFLNRVNGAVYLGHFLKDSELGALVRDENEWRFMSFNGSTWNNQTVEFLPEMNERKVEIQVISDFDDGKNVFVIRSNEDLGIYEIKESKKLERIVKCQHIQLPEDAEYDRIAFANFSDAKFKDILHFNTTGLNVYRFNDTTGGYEPHLFSTMFSKYRNWNTDLVNSMIVHDTDGDQRDELLFTTPAGFQVFRAVQREDDFYLEEVLLKSDNNKHRFMNLMAVLPNGKNGIQRVIFHDGNKLLLTDVGKDIMTITFPQDVKPKEISPKITLITPAVQYSRWLHEHLDLSELLQPLNSLTGKVELSIPLVQVDNPFGISVRKYFQYRDVPGDDCLARGWTFPLDYIVVDTVGSIFEQDFRYSIVRKNYRISLFPSFEQSTEDKVVFEVQPELELTYFKNDQKWVMEDKEESIKYIFGNFDSTKGLRYAEQDSERKFPIEWYLVREEDATGSFVNYLYDLENNSAKLTSITTDQDATVKFVYNKGKMQSFAIQTQFYKQVVTLEMTNDNDKFYLTGIKQDNYPLFEFKYESDKMTEIIYPNGLKSTLEYGTVITESEKRNELELPSEDFTIAYGPDYSVIAIAHPDKKHAQISVRDVLRGSHTIKTFNTTLFNNEEPFKGYQVVIQEKLFGIIRSFKLTKILDFFQFSKDNWNITQHNLTADAIITSNVNSIYIADAGSLQIIKIGANDTLVSHVQNITSNFVIRATNRGLLLYDDQKFVLQYTPNRQYLKGLFSNYDSNYIKETIATVNRFEMSEDAKADLIRALKLNMIQMYGKFIILRALEIKHGVLKVLLRLKILDEKNEIKDSDRYRIDIQNVEEMKRNVKSKANDSCNLRYILYLEKYAINIDCTGPTVDGYENALQSELKSIAKDQQKVQKAMGTIINFSNNMATLEKEILDANPVAFDVSLLGISIDEKGVKTGGKVISYNGTAWSQSDQNSDLDLVLRDKLRLVKKAGEACKIYNDTEVIHDSKTTDFGSVKLVWPLYFASQAKEGPLLYFFDENKQVQLNETEKLSLLSNNVAIVTTTDNNTKLSMLPVKSMLESDIAVLTKQTLQLSPGVRRVTTYENGGVELDGLSNAYVFTNSKILPGGNKNKYGWYQHSYDLKTRQLQRSVRDSEGKLIKYIDPIVDEEQEKLNSTTVITDKAGRLPIVDVAPMNVLDGDYSYYGFEQYERTSFNNTVRWTFDDKKVKTEGGNRFLQLETGDSFEGVLHIRSANEKYLFSCLLKTEDIGKMSELVTIVNIKQEDKEMLQVGEPIVQHSIAARWHYVELNITTTNLLNPTLVTVKISPKSGKSLILDHVRFSPMNVDFRAYAYRQPFWGVSRVMHNSGLMTQYLLDSHGNRVVYVSELGKVTDFLTYSKSYNIRGSDKFPHVMEVRPSNGEIECFNDPKSWTPDIDKQKWSMERGTLMHSSDTTDTIKRALLSNYDSFVVRFVYNLNSKDAVIKVIVNDMTLDVVCKPSQGTCANKGNISDYGEIVVFISKSHRAVWFEGSLVSETSHHLPKFENIGFTISGSVTINEMLVLYDPSMKITYYNRLGLPRQTLTMQDEKFVRIKEVLYDEIDRSIVTTKWTTVEKKDNLFFDFHDNFIEIVESKRLTGLVNDLNKNCEGYPYFRKDYADNPITEEVTISMPGKTFSEDSKYSRQLARRSKYQALDKLFPAEDGFTQMVEIRQNKTYHIVVNDAKNKKVAYFIAAAGTDPRITTYEYDDGGNLVLELPPVYHNVTTTLNQTFAFWGRNLSETELRLQSDWGIRYSYNSEGQILSKTTPDSGTQHYFYDGNVVRFLVHTDKENKTDKTVFYSYGSAGQIVREAIVDIPPTEFNQYLGGSTMIPNSTNFVEFYHGEYDESPTVRHRSQQSIRRIGDKQMMESLINDNANRIVKKIFIVPALNTSYAIDYEYLNDKLSMIRYPIGVNGTDFKVKYTYNNAGDMITIGTVDDPEKFVKLQYNADSLVQEMQFEPGSPYTYKREYGYNEPGYLNRIADMFLEETVSYLEADGYGNAFSMIFEGLISRTTFNATWFERSNPALSRLQLNDMHPINRTLTAFCIKSLQSEGYFDKSSHPLKSFYPELDDSISEKCRTKQFRSAFHAHEFPQYYGHSYDYDSHEQMIRAKYFQSPTEASWKPFKETSFMPIDGIDSTASKEIWNILLRNNFISRNCYNVGICAGLPGNNSLLKSDVPNESYAQALMLNAISTEKTLSDTVFERKCLKWFESRTRKPLHNCTTLKDIFESRNIIGENTNQTQNALNNDFRAQLHKYTRFIPHIVRKLHKHFATHLGKSPADVLSCSFDANGNHRLFRKGAVRYSFEYTNGTNQIHTITKSDNDEPDAPAKIYKMKHNSEGSVIVAQHKNISKIEYDPLLNRPTIIHMDNGRKLKFEYDVRGERTFKQVIEKDNHVSKEKYYIRDLNRNVLVDVQLAYVAKNKVPDIQITSYVYSDRGLIGFVRNDEFYSVFTDHEGSTRLVIKNGEVKAAYDYLPFGIIFRKAERDLDGAISYLYTGQEWDEETGLYNYHTRLYDPEIGRFYQVDPKSQYASPYLYAGNSPLGLVDPDGQFFMTLIAIALAVVGAYLGAAAANGSWNPAEWNWRSVNTWLGLFAGALTGATLPSTAISTFTYLTATLGLSVSTSLSVMIGSGIGLSYFTMAAANNDWNPDHWDMKSPATWNAFFAGVATSISVITNPHNLVTSYAAITSTVGKGLFIAGKLILTTGFAYMLGVIQQKGEFDPSKWDFTKPGLYMSLFSGSIQATSTVKFISNLPENFKSVVKKISNLLNNKQLSVVLSKFKQHLGSDFSKQLMSAAHYLNTYSGNLKTVGQGTFNVFLYTTVSSLRISTIVDKDKVPEFGVAMEIIKQIQKVVSISDYMANNLDLIVRVKAVSDAHRKTRSITVESEQNSTSSGASSFSRSFLDFIRFRFGIPNPPIIPSSTEVNPYSSETKTSTGKVFTISNCFRMYDSTTNKPFIKCYGHRSITSIHSKLSHGGGITGDSFQSCYPISYHHIPSVSCDGSQSTMLFSGYDAPRLFDYTDGWILLARVMPTAIKSIVSGVRSVFTGGDRTPSRASASEAELASLINDLAGLNSWMTLCNNSGWATKAVDELNKDIREFLSESTRNHHTYWMLKERIAVLREDVLEETVFAQNGGQIGVNLDVPMMRMLEMSQSRDIQGPKQQSLQYANVGLLK